jgi:hypothetical protein
MRPVVAILFPAILIMAGLAAAPARAQQQPTTAQALAELIHEALPRTSSGEADNSWDAVSIRISRLMHWHLASPDAADAVEIQRRGWLAADGDQIGITAFGDRDQVTTLAFEGAFSAYSFQPPADDRELFAAMTARGITVGEIERRSFPEELSLPLGQISYTVSAEGRHAARFTSSTHCTPPGSAAARRCWISHALVLGD